MRAVFTWGGVLIAVIALAGLAPYGAQHGWGAVEALMAAQYRGFMDLVFGWTAPFLAPLQDSALGKFPVWWREGAIMFAMIVSQWSQIIAQGKATRTDALEYLAVSVIAGAGSYALGASDTLSEAAFFGVAGVFAQLLARGLVSLIDGRASEPEAWAGRYLLRSTTLVFAVAAAVLLVNAGQALRTG
ncbi:MAG: hypothetical protein ACREHE_13010 [Rhizomicrobium sp.]